MKWRRFRGRDRSKHFAWLPVRARSVEVQGYVSGPDIWIWLKMVNVRWNRYRNRKWYEERKKL